MRKDPMPLGLAIGLLIVGILLGSVFTFGMQFWNDEVSRESCTVVQTQLLSYDEIRQSRRHAHIKEISIDCANGERYFIDGVSVNKQLRNAVSAISKHDDITLLIHPNSSTIVELSNEQGNILAFEDTIQKLGNEATGFLFLGVFMYFCALVGVYYAILQVVSKMKTRKKK